MKIIEFDLEKDKAGEPVFTREGKEARIICWDVSLHGGKKIGVLIRNTLDREYIESFIRLNENGMYYDHPDTPSELDLVHHYTPTYKPFDYDTVPLFKEIRHKNTKIKTQILSAGDRYVKISGLISSYNYNELLEFFTFADGSPCGQLV